jgi:hypothetical protein
MLIRNPSALCNYCHSAINTDPNAAIFMDFLNFIELLTQMPVLMKPSTTNIGV